MSLPIIFDPDAQTEFDSGYDYYESRKSGLGDTFAEAVDQIISRISDQIVSYPFVYRTVRKAIVRGFPYCVYYREEPSRILIVSVFHTSRDPSIWQTRSDEIE